MNQSNMLRYFKFYSFKGEYSREMIENLRLNRIYAPSLEKLNDPFEGMWEGCNIHMEYPECDDEVFGSLKRKGIISLCTSTEDKFPCTPNSILMWAHYSDSNRGFAIEFNNSIFEIESSRFGHGKIEYNYHLPYRDSNLQDGELAEQDKKRILFWKSNVWEYEQEVRLCCDGSNKYVQLPMNCIKAIYCGSKISEAHLDLLRSIVKENGWEIYVLKPNNMTYEFNLSKDNSDNVLLIEPHTI